MIRKLAGIVEQASNASMESKHGGEGKACMRGSNSMRVCMQAVLFALLVRFRGGGIGRKDVWQLAGSGFGSGSGRRTAKSDKRVR